MQAPFDRSLTKASPDDAISLLERIWHASQVKGFYYLTIFTVASVGIAEEKVNFAKDIRPILSAKCTGCHGGVKQAGGVSFVHKSQVINFIGDSKVPVVVPGDAKGSELIHRILLPADDSDHMPPEEDHPEGLSEREIDLLTRWVNEGAEWREHWSFEALEHPDIPDTDQAKTDIDRLIVARLNEAGLSPAPTAPPERLLRRISLDTIGLPPTLDELDAFLSAYEQDPEKAVAAAIDDRLERPAFGEKWASMWLDLVRYADSMGLGNDSRRNIWPYRDWVVRAFNADMPFDQFTIRQLAGDLLPDPTLDDLIATAAHRNTQTNNEGGTDDEEFRTEAVVDRVNSTWQIWGSTTFGCVQCHDHPYDAYTHEEYYEFMAFFNNTVDSDLTNDAPLLEVPKNPSLWEKAREIDREIRKAQIELWEPGNEIANHSQWSPLPLASVESNNETKLDVAEVENQHHFFTVGTVARAPTFTIVSQPSSDNEPITALRFTVLPQNLEKALKDSEWGFRITDLKAHLIDEQGQSTPIGFAASIPDVPYNPSRPLGFIGANGKSFQAWTRINQPRQIVLVPKEPIKADGKLLEIKIENHTTLLGATPLILKRGYFESSSNPELTNYSNSKEYTKQKGHIKKLANERKKMPSSTVPIMAERPANIARPTHVFARGNFLEKEQQVSSGLPASLPRSPADGASSPPNRLDMAKWWVSGEHPLTSRVFVNRLWEQLFGTGIVTTLEDFGSSGEDPSHPELLDYLALRFQNDHQWSIKSILREMMLSHTYQQSAKASPELLQKDPKNRLLARGPRNRLSAEVIRDQALAIGGILTRTIGGKPVHPPLPVGVWNPFDKNDLWKTPEKGEDGRHRRSVYTYTKRSIPFPTMATFDAPSREFCNPRRLVSNTPLQALNMLNDISFHEAAQGLAQHMMDAGDAATPEAISMGYRMATSQTPSPEKLEKLVDLYEQMIGDYQSQIPPEEEGESVEAEKAAYTIVAQVLLNLDEVVTK